MHPILTTLVNSALVGAGRLSTLRFDAQSRRAGDVNEEVLWSILKRQAGTAFGRRHDFGAIRTVKDFQRAVPLATYDDLRGDMERMARGEQNVLTADPVTAFALSSGTTGNQKLIPLTSFTSRRNQALFSLMRGTLLRAVPGVRAADRGILLMSATLTGQTEGGHPTGSLTALLMSSMVKGRWTPWFSPAEVFFVRKQADAHYLHLLFGLAEPGLGSLNAPFASGLLDLFQLLEARWPALLEDLERGTLNTDLTLPPELGQPIRARLWPHPERAHALRREFEQGFDGIARRLWPRLSHASAVTSGSFHIYAEKLARYLGEVPLYSSTYACSEAIVGVNLGLGKPVYALLPTTAFFEFIPAAELDAPHPSVRRIDELNEGERYEIVLTTFGGLYRYRLGDVIEVASHHHRTPVVEFIHRRGSLLNIAGEKTSEKAAHHSLVEALSKAGMELVDFSTMEDTEPTPKRYVFFVELHAQGQRVDVAQLAELLEEALRRANPFYVTLRARLGPLAFHVMQPGTFGEFRELLVRRGASSSQVKIPRVVTEGPLAEFLREHRA